MNASGLSPRSVPSAQARANRAGRALIAQRKQAEANEPKFPGCKTLLRGVVNFADSISQENLAANYAKLLKADPVWKDVETLVEAGLVGDVFIDTLAKVAAADSSNHENHDKVFPDDDAIKDWNHTRKTLTRRGFIVDESEG